MKQSKELAITGKKSWLPIGSVVTLKEGTMPLMIFGRCQIAISDGVQWDYIAVPYPEGNSNERHTYLFNREQVDELLFTGYQTPAEKKMRKIVEQAVSQSRLHSHEEHGGRDCDSSGFF